MKLLLDACVLYPNVMREMLLGAADLGLFEPQWSARICEEWARAAARLGAVQEMQARGEIALLNARFHRANQHGFEAIERRLYLKDANDIHVLAAAIHAGSDGIVTMNAKDFPRHILAEEGLARHTPDEILRQFFDQDPEGLRGVAEAQLAAINAHAERPFALRALLKKARLPRLGKALDAA